MQPRGTIYYWTYFEPAILRIKKNEQIIMHLILFFYYFCFNKLPKIFSALHVRVKKKAITKNFFPVSHSFDCIADEKFLKTFSHTKDA